MLEILYTQPYDAMTHANLVGGSPVAHIVMDGWTDVGMQSRLRHCDSSS